MGARHR